MKVVILGGGISGLSAAYFLLKKNRRLDVTLLEKGDRLGGWIETEKRGDFLFETGPRTFQAARCPELLQMIQELGLEKELIYSTPKAKDRYLWHREKLRPLRSFWWTMFGAICKDFVTPKRVGSEETIYEFGCRRIGKKATELFLGPMTTGIHGGDMKRLSIRSAFPLLFSWEQQEGSLWKGALRTPTPSAKGLFTLRSGMKSLIEALSRLPIKFELNTSVQQLRSDGVVAADRFFPADRVISALPASEISRLTQVPLPIRYESIQVVNLGFKEPVLSHEGYGYLVPPSAQQGLLGMIWDSSLFPLEGKTVLTAMVRDEKPLDRALEALALHVHIQQPPAEALVTSAQIPQYEVGHEERVQDFEQQVERRFPSLKCVGNYWSGTSVEECLGRSKRSL